MHRDDDPDRDCRCVEVVSDTDQPDAATSLGEREVRGVQVPGLRGGVAGVLQPLECVAHAPCIGPREDPRHRLKRERARTDRDDNVNEAVEKLTTLVARVPTPAVGERRRRQSTGHDVKRVSPGEAFEAMRDHRLTDDFSVRKVALESRRVHRIRLDGGSNREAGLLKAKSEAAGSRKDVEESCGTHHSECKATGGGGQAVPATAPIMIHSMEECELVVVGAGPAGLAAAAAARDAGASFVVLERGAPATLRDRARPEQLVTGVGGAGLYSDGKFSFAPSATALWRLEPRGALREAYAWTAELLRAHGIASPAFPEHMGDGPADRLKRYPSHYMSLESRLELIESLATIAGERILTGIDACLRVEPTGVFAELPGDSVASDAAVLASGRFGPLRQLAGVAPVFRRVELGMRVEQSADRFALDAGEMADLLDPKWVRLSADGRHEWRTFCCCRCGEVVDTDFGDLITVSGRADGPPTDRSNFGLNVRFLDRREAEEALAAALDAAQRPPVRMEAKELLDDPAASRAGEALGPVTAAALADGLLALGEDVGAAFDEAVLHMPAIEGVGYYPPVRDVLQVSPALWAAGDATGAFRGLVAALVSGRLAALQALESVRAA